MSSQLIAHIRRSDHETQPLTTHLENVSKQTGIFASKIGLQEAGEILGLAHDFGKASAEFQKYLQTVTGFDNPDADQYIESQNLRGRIDHSTAGAQLVYEALKNKGQKGDIAGQLLGICIASHHSGLIDALTPSGENNFQRRMGKADERTHREEAASQLTQILSSLNDLITTNVDDQAVSKLINLRVDGDTTVTCQFRLGLLARFLLSCLLDADRLDTADFETPKNVQIRNDGNYQPWNLLIQRLNKRLEEFNQQQDKNHVDQLRAKVSESCFAFAAKPKGIYQLTVPTGGGKTLASLRFALNHVDVHQMNRIFYIIPYTSIIDQNADEIRKILEDRDENNHILDRIVLEHHSNLTPEEETYRQNLLAQNWDAPVVFTTQVQFLETLFAAGTRSARRMHQLANSVIILDEVQTIPINMIQMLNMALRFLVETCGSTVVLCTATQPPLHKIDARHRSLTIHSDQHIIENEKELYEGLKRVDVFDSRKPAGWELEEIADLTEAQRQESGSVLIVVNTKKSARALYQTLETRKKQGACLYHLSTSMCPAHRMKTLSDIKGKLDKEPVICVSTQLIEAGVDIDFGSVIRYLAGLDSIVQAAGRCNRHGKRAGLGKVWIVNPADENIQSLKDIQIGAEQARRILDDFQASPQLFDEDRISLEAMAQYYRYYYYARKDDMTYRVGASSSIGREDDLFNLLSSNTLSSQAYARTHDHPHGLIFTQSFQSAAKEFQVINSPTRGVVVPYSDEGKRIIGDLCSDLYLEKNYPLLKQTQLYTVNLYTDAFSRMARAGAIYEVQDRTGIYAMRDGYYNITYGWEEKMTANWEFEIH